MIRIINEENTTNFKYAIKDTSTGEILLAADSLIEMFIAFQNCIYTAVIEKSGDCLIEERLKHRQRTQNVRKG